MHQPHILINALSVSNQSGRQLLCGHIGRLMEWLPDVTFSLLHHAGNADLVIKLPAITHTISAPACTTNWFKRSAWERLRLPQIIREQNVSLLFSPAGIAVPTAPCRQLVFCQNPWALVSGIRKGITQQAKAAVQRRAYRATVKRADVMVFNSDFMQQAYRANAGRPPQESFVVHQGVDDRVFAAASAATHELSSRTGIVTVSAMAPHKGIETNLQALSELLERGQETTLTLVGGWPDTAYRNTIERLIQQNSLHNHVTITGHVSDADLFTAYSKARVFLLMSQCESFGFPAVEAHAFGTPTVCSDCCALPEMQADGGLKAQVGNAKDAANALYCLLTDDALWQQKSDAARRNSQRFKWDACSKGMLQAVQSVLAL